MVVRIGIYLIEIWQEEGEGQLKKGHISGWMARAEKRKLAYITNQKFSFPLIGPLLKM